MKKATHRMRIEHSNNSVKMFGIPREKFWKIWILSHDKFEYREDFVRDLENKIVFYHDLDPTEVKIELDSPWASERYTMLYDRLLNYDRYCSDRNKCAKFFETSVYDIKILPCRGQLSHEQEKEIEKTHRKNWFNNRKIREMI